MIDSEEHRRERAEISIRIVELRRRAGKIRGRKLAKGVRQGVRTRMKRKETTLGGSVEECIVPERIIDEDRLVNRGDIESRVSSGDTNSSGSRGIKYKV
jgi:hypothetical protein